MHEHDSHTVPLKYIRMTSCIYHEYTHKLKHNHNHEGIFDNSDTTDKHVRGADNAKVIGSIQTWNHWGIWWWGYGTNSNPTENNGLCLLYPGKEKKKNILSSWTWQQNQKGGLLVDVHEGKINNTSEL